jgi:hypothetical protein
MLSSDMTGHQKMLTILPERTVASASNRGDSNAIRKTQNPPIPFLEFFQSTAPLSQQSSGDKVGSQPLQAVDNRADHQRQNERSSGDLSFEEPEKRHQTRPPIPGTPRLTIESPSSESDTLDRGSSRVSADHSSDECSSYYSDSCAIEREPRNSENTSSRGTIRPCDIANKPQQQSNPSTYRTYLTRRRLSRVDPRETSNLGLGVDISCSEYDGDDEGRIRPKERSMGSIGLRTGT